MARKRGSTGVEGLEAGPVSVVASDTAANESPASSVPPSVPAKGAALAVRRRDGPASRGGRVAISPAAIVASRREATPDVQTTMIPLTLIDHNPRSLRRRYEPEQIEQLADSIRARGVLQPIQVRPHPDDPGRYLVTFGEFRAAAARLAGDVVIPAIIKDQDEMEALLDALTTHLYVFRLDPVELAEAVESAMLALSVQEGRTLGPKEVAMRLGMSERRIHHFRAVHRLELETKHILRDEALPERRIRALTQLHDPQAQVEMAQLLVEQEDLTYEEIALVVARVRDEQLSPRAAMEEVRRRLEAPPVVPDESEAVIDVTPTYRTLAIAEALDIVLAHEESARAAAGREGTVTDDGAEGLAPHREHVQGPVEVVGARVLDVPVTLAGALDTSGLAALQTFRTHTREIERHAAAVLALELPHSLSVRREWYAIVRRLLDRLEEWNLLLGGPPEAQLVALAGAAAE